MNEADFHINVKPISIDLECPHCYHDIVIPWDEIDAPDYWGDDWGEANCPYCNEPIKLGTYEYD